MQKAKAEDLLESTQGTQAPAVEPATPHLHIVLTTQLAFMNPKAPQPGLYAQACISVSFPSG